MLTRAVCPDCTIADSLVKSIEWCPNPAILTLNPIRYFIASILVISDDRMRIAAVLFLKTSLRSSLSFHPGELLTLTSSSPQRDIISVAIGSKLNREMLKRIIHTS